ncbi:MAG: dipeptide ABC transporter ATP-binding protein [Burkholderiales bacterium]
MGEILLSVRDLTTVFGADPAPLRAVDGVGFDIRRGETFALVGESGCGKSVAALSLMRLLPAAGRIASGSVVLNGQDLLKLPETSMRSMRGRRMAMIFQEPMTSLNPVMSVGDQISEALPLETTPSRHAGARVLELLEAVGIPDPRRRCRDYPHQLSGGMKQRVMIAIALACDPDLLIADEPTTALDVTTQSQVLELLRGLKQKIGMAILLITHDLGVVAENADTVAVMYAGQIVEQAPRDAFFENRLHPYSRKLFESLPNLDKRSTRLSVIPGSVPRLNQAFQGCRFAGRCASAMEVCRGSIPRWITVGGRGVACHLHDPQIGAAEPPAHLEQPAYDRPQSSAADGNIILSVADLKVHFPIHAGVFKRVVGYVHAVDGVTLAIPAGRTLAVVGESGCGKTTVGKSILQLIRPSAGTVRFKGQELTQLGARELRALRRDFQIVFQDPFSSMNPRMMVGDIIEEGIRALGLKADIQQRRARIGELLQQVGLPDDIHTRYPHEFSGGQRQRIAIARALAVNPTLLICDEPTSALDVSVQAQILNLLKDLQDRLGLAYLFITHNVSVMEYLAHEVAVMYLGRIVERGTVDEVLRSPRHPYTQALLSAVPVIESGSHRAVIRLKGEPPSPIKPPSGCHFHPRCAQAMETCRNTYPGYSAFSLTHRVYCHLYPRGEATASEQPEDTVS